MLSSFSAFTQKIMETKDFGCQTESIVGLPGFKSSIIEMDEYFTDTDIIEAIGARDESTDLEEYR